MDRDHDRHRVDAEHPSVRTPSVLMLGVLLMSIQPRTTEYVAVDDPSWLGSAHGLDAVQTITLDVSKFDASTYYPNGFIPGGTKLGLVTVSGKYGPYDDTATDGRQTLKGCLVAARAVNGQTAITGGLFTHGAIRESRLPFTIDAAGKADVAGRIWFI